MSEDSFFKLPTIRLELPAIYGIRGLSQDDENMVLRYKT